MGKGVGGLEWVVVWDRYWGVGEVVKRGGFEGGKRGWNGVGVM